MKSNWSRRGPRHNGGMPRLTHAPAAMPDGAVRAQRVISTVSRLEALRDLRDHPGSTRQGVVDRTGLSYEAVRKVLSELVAFGYVSSHGGGRSETYSANWSRFAEDLGALWGYISS